MSPPDLIDDTLRNHFGFEKFLEGQRQVIEHLMAGHSAAAVFPTAGGKSLCYQLPALLLDGLTLVVSPLIALMKDQIDALARRGIAAQRLDSSLSVDEFRGVMRDVRRGSLRLLYVAPERFNNERFRRALSEVRISLFAVDEAHCISEWGHNFRPDYLKLVQFARRHGAERVLGLTATATKQVLEDICRQFDIAPEHAVRTSFHRPNLSLVSRVVDAQARDDDLVTSLRERPLGPTIVYVTLQATAERVASLLQAAGFDAQHYHAGMKPERRASVQDWFMRSERGVVVATIAFGMGIDKTDIRYVYHYNLPKSLESYAQEVGRAGRDGQPSVCEILACSDDLGVLENFAYGDTPGREAVHDLTHSIFGAVEPGDMFDVSYYELAASHDIRVLVVRTLLTYLELEGYLEGGTPFYQGYRFKPLSSLDAIVDSHDGEQRDLIRSLLSQANVKRIWCTIDIDAAAIAIASTRGQLIATLDQLHDQGAIELQSSGIRHTYRVLRLPERLEELTDELQRRALRREASEIDRLRQVLELISHDGCLAAALSAHFGEALTTPCGHCSWCSSVDGQPAPALLRRCSPPVPPNLWTEVEALRQDPKYAPALTEPRARARFLCGIASPLTTRCRLTKHQLFGQLAHTPFGEVLDMCQSS